MLVKVAGLVGALLIFVVFEDLFGCLESTAARLDIRFLDLDFLLACLLGFSFRFYKIPRLKILVGQIESGVAS